MDTTKHTTSFLSSLPIQDGKPVMRMGMLRIERELTSGMLSMVFLGQHVGLDIPVILRVIKPQLIPKIKDSDALLHAGQAIAKVRHPHMATIYDLGFCGHFPYMMLEYISGVPMCERMKQRPYSALEALQLLLPIADGLATYWRHGLLHRGVSPKRVSIASDGLPILDTVILPPGHLDPFFCDVHTPFMAGFWAPEILERKVPLVPLDPRTDMFSFGASLFYAVTGETPYGTGDDQELLERTRSGPAADPSSIAPELPAILLSFIRRCLAPEAKNRFTSIRDFQTSLFGVRDQLTRPSSSESLFGSNDQTLDTQKPKAISSGDAIGNCELQEKAGSGAFGVVYRARHKTLDLDVAVKILPLEIAQKDPSYIEMFLREARTAARIRHSNVIGIYEAGEQNGQYYLVMEYAPNGTLLERMLERGGKLSVRETIPILLSAARGLEAAEKLRIVHRDIKPENLMFGIDDVLKIADLGLAKRLPPVADEHSIQASLMKEQLTLKRGDSSQVVGTPAFMAPELALDPSTADTRSDLYALGVTGYYALTGQLPFKGNTALETILKHVQTIPEPAHSLRPDIPMVVSELIGKLLEKEPELRYQRAAELVLALDELGY